MGLLGSSYVSDLTPTLLRLAPTEAILVTMTNLPLAQQAMVLGGSLVLRYVGSGMLAESSGTISDFLTIGGTSWLVYYMSASAQAALATAAANWIAENYLFKHYRSVAHDPCDDFDIRPLRR